MRAAGSDWLMSPCAKVSLPGRSLGRTRHFLDYLSTLQILLMQEEEDLTTWGAGALAANPEEAVPEAAGDSARLAIVDLDWERVAAADLLALLSSFLGKVRIGRAVVKGHKHVMACMPSFSGSCRADG